ncbi:MAG: 7-carboxy-7-deazaguanine synthase [Microthrixaceae bacterium]
MSYRVKELFATLQGEGVHTGRAAVFCRFTGCNLWNGHEEHRATAVCRFCDTDFVGTDGPGGGTFATAADLARAAIDRWNEGFGGGGRPYVVCTGGEPLLQLDEPLVAAFHDAGLEVAVETNGTRPAPPGLDWVCVSPKAGAEVVLERADEWKVVVPQEGFAEADLLAIEGRARGAALLAQPMDDPVPARAAANTRWALDWCRRHPRWRLGLQTHKYLGIP